MGIPLAEKLRPKKLEEFIGQKHLIGQGKPVRKMLQSGKLLSIILWGPPGCGKTTLARLASLYTKAKFVSFSAVTSRVADIRKVIAQAKEDKRFFKRETILFIDEIHRFNKSQQDAFLPHVEDGTIVLIGATTENPGFEVNAPLISRSQLFILYSLTNNELKEIIKKAILFYPKHRWSEKALEHIIKNANGDARVAINAVELAVSMAKNITLKIVEQAIQKKAIYYGKKGDNHYDTISAFIKSMRGSDPDATLHYLARMIKAGEDPMFIARRMVIFASEDIGNALPTALVLATSCMEAVHMVGMPEASLILAQTATYLAMAKKSISSTVGIMKALKDIDEINIDPVPINLRNPSNKVVKGLGYGQGHVRYPWLVEKKKVKSASSADKQVKEEYLPKNLRGKKYYIPDWK